jgi:hypothetical protein
MSHLTFKINERGNVMMIFTRKIKMIVLTCLFFFIGCSRNGFEGNVQLYGSNNPASGIEITASTNTDIKEEQSKASIVVKTDSKGHFNIRGLLPNKNYVIRSSDPRFDSKTLYEGAPEKGTKIIKEPLLVCPKPPDGIWLFDANLGTFTQEIIRGDEKKVSIRVHEGMIGGAWGNSSAFSVSDEDIKSLAASIPRNGLLVVGSGALSDIGQLFKIPRQVLAHKEIPEGWYYNIHNFYEEDFMRVGNKMLKVHVQKPNLKEAYRSESGKFPIWAFPLQNFSPGYYIFTTNVATGQRASQVLFGESHPKEGFIVEIGRDDIKKSQ